MKRMTWNCTVHLRKGQGNTDYKMDGGSRKHLEKLANIKDARS